MNQQKLEKAIAMAKNDMKILENPSSKLYPILIRKLAHMIDDPVEPTAEEAKENVNLEPIKPSKLIKKSLATLKNPLQSRLVEVKPGAKNGRLVDMAIKKSAPTNIVYSPRQSSGLKSPVPQKFQSRLHNRQPRKSVVPSHSTSSHDFVVPKLDSPNPTRTGLIQKSKKSDLESMRQESDHRLKIAMKHLITARKKALEDEKKARLNKYSKVKSRLGSTHWGSQKNEDRKVKPMERELREDIGEEFMESPTSIKSRPNIQDISIIPHTVESKSVYGTQLNNELSPSAIAQIDSKVSAKESPYVESLLNHVNTVPCENTESYLVDAHSPKPSKIKPKPQNESSFEVPKFMKVKNHTALKSKITPKKNADKSDHNTRNSDHIVDMVLQVLEAKLDPMLAQVQQNWESAVAQIDEKITSALEKHGEIVQESFLVDMKEPSILVESETPLFQVTTGEPKSPEKEFQILPRLYHDTNEDQILIHRETTCAPQKHAEVRSEHNILVLPASMIEDILQNHSRKKKWKEAYYGDGFDSVAAIER